MKHATFIDVEEDGLLLRIRPRSTNEGVNFGQRQRSVARKEGEEKVHMRKTTFLKFDRMHTRMCMPKDLVVGYII
jgi:hypothetical protein